MVRNEAFTPISDTPPIDLAISRLAGAARITLSSFMATILRRSTLHLALVAAAAPIGFGCSGAPAPVVQAASSGAHPSDPVPAVPKIIGRVLLSATGKPPPAGGVVYLEDAPKQPGVATTATIDFDHKAFSPAIAVITAGGTVTFGNKDSLSHHVFSPDVADWDTGFVGKGATSVRRFDKVGAIALLCNIHPEMLGYLLVIPSTAFGKLGVDGTYVITSVPPGTYRATLWSPRLPTVTQSVTVPDEGAATANFELRPTSTAVGTP